MEIEDYYKTDEFKSLSRLKRIWIRMKFSFIETMSMI